MLILDSALHNPYTKPNLSQPAFKIRKLECQSMMLAELPLLLYFSEPLISCWEARCQYEPWVVSGAGIQMAYAFFFKFLSPSLYLITGGFHSVDTLLPLKGGEEKEKHNNF